MMLEHFHYPSTTVTHLHSLPLAMFLSPLVSTILLSIFLDLLFLDREEGKNKKGKCDRWGRGGRRDKEIILKLKACKIIEKHCLCWQLGSCTSGQRSKGRSIKRPTASLLSILVDQPKRSFGLSHNILQGKLKTNILASSSYLSISASSHIGQL